MTRTEKYLWGLMACPLGYLFFESLAIVLKVGPDMMFGMTLFGGIVGAIIGFIDIRKQRHASATSSKEEDNFQGDGPARTEVTSRDGDDTVTCDFGPGCLFCSEACPRFEANRDHGRQER